MTERRFIVVSSRDGPEHGPYRMCPTCQYQGGQPPCEDCDNGDQYEIHEDLEEEYFA